eukprot:COSAG05_NODE_6897_length_885_cov_1.208651_1_plen_86_part_00
MGDSVAQVQEDQKAAGLCSRAQLILTCQDSQWSGVVDQVKKCCPWSGVKQEIKQQKKHTGKFLALPERTEVKQWSGVVDQVKQEI